MKTCETALDVRILYLVYTVYGFDYLHPVEKKKQKTKNKKTIDPKSN